MVRRRERRRSAKRPKLRFEFLDPRALEPYAGNARAHPRRQIQRLCASISYFGFVMPALINATGVIVAGHARVQAAKILELDRIPCIRVEHLSDAQQRAYRLADNRLAEAATWDSDLLSQELRALAELDLDFSIESTGFDTAEIDLILEESEQKRTDDPADTVPPLATGQPPIARLGDLWVLGKNKLFCGDAREAGSYRRLMNGDEAQIVF